MTAPERHDPARSGWCLTRLHEACAWSGCHCSCHATGLMSADFEDGEG